MLLADLPIELLSLILSKLFPKDRKTFSLVCRSWKAIVSHSPWLMFYQRSKLTLKFIQSNDADQDLYLDIDNAELCCSKYGWLLMSRDDYTFFFFDPSDGMKIEVPAMTRNYATVGFFNPPTSPHCFIFGITDEKKSTSVEIGMLKLGEDEWKECFYDATKSPFPVSSCIPIMHRGLLYCLDMNGNIGTFDINRQFSKRSWMSYTKCLSPPGLCKLIKERFLFKIEGRNTIFALFVSQDEGKVNVFKLKESEMKWESVYNLGDKMLYVSHSLAFAKTAPKKSMANRIYFPMLHRDKVVFYSLDTRKYHSDEDHSIEGNSANISSFRYLRFATWYTPSPTLEPKQLAPRKP